jgi:hypothetical protein
MRSVRAAQCGAGLLAMIVVCIILRQRWLERMLPGLLAKSAEPEQCQSSDD